MFNPIMDNLVRNEFGAVSDKKIRIVMDIKSSNSKLYSSSSLISKKSDPEMASNKCDITLPELIERFVEVYEKEVADTVQVNNQTGSVSIESQDIISLISGECEESRGQMWKSLTQLESYMRNDFVNYDEIA